MKKLFLLLLIIADFGCKKKNNSPSFTYSQLLDSANISIGQKYRYGSDTVVFNSDNTITETYPGGTFTTAIKCEGFYSKDFWMKTANPELYFKIYTDKSATYNPPLANRLKEPYYKMCVVSDTARHYISFFQKSSLGIGLTRIY